MRSPITTAIAIAAGIIVLLGYFVPPEMTQFAFVLTLRSILVGWAVTLAGMATLVGIINLFMVHTGRMVAKRNPDRYSFLLVISFIAALGFGLYLTPADAQYQKAITSILTPISASLIAVLAVTLTFAGFRLFQRRKGLIALAFAVSAVFFLLLGAGLLAPLQDMPGVGEIIAFLQRLPLGGGRGILLGIALGSLTAGLRVLLGTHRPYSG